MNISEKKIDNIFDNTNFSEMKTNKHSRARVKQILQAANITGKDGLLDVLEEVAEHYRTTLANLNSAYAALPPGPQRGQTQVNIEQMRPRLEKLEAHLSQWRQK